jgi:hypothetical protein
MQLDSYVQPKSEPGQPPPDRPVQEGSESTGSAYTSAAADAYKPREGRQSAVFRPGDQRTGLITRVQDSIPPAIKDDITNVLKDGQADCQNGKWSDKTKGEWKKLVDDLKEAGTSPNDIAGFLNELGSGINAINHSKDVKNLVGMAVKSVGAGKYEAYMLINGPNIDKAQNNLDAAFGHESNTVIKAGTFGGPPEQHI